jgi:hypothetical protein
MRLLLFIALALLSMPALAQTYDINLSLPGAPINQFAGSLIFNPGATCPGTAEYCSGASPQFTNVSIDNGLFTGLVGAGQYTLVDYLGNPPNDDTTDIWQLNFTLSAPFGQASSMSILSAWYTQDYNFLWSCDPCTGSVTDPPAAAPELDPAGWGAGISLLGGLVLLVRGRRR